MVPHNIQVEALKSEYSNPVRWLVSDTINVRINASDVFHFLTFPDRLTARWLLIGPPIGT